MKVLLTHKFHHLTGGAEVFYFEVARVLKNHGHEVAFFSTEDKKNIDTGDLAHFVASPNYNGSFISKLKAIPSTFYSASKRDAFAKLVDEFKPDIVHAFAVHVHLTPAIFEAAKARNIPVVMSCNDYKHICPNYKIYDGEKNCELCKGGKFYNAIKKRCCKGSLAFSAASAIEAYIHEHKKVYDNLVDKYLFASEFMLNKTKEFWADKNINYGVLRNPFKPEDYTANYDGDYALYFGRIIDEKGVDRIVEAAKTVSLPIKIIGDGPQLNKLQELVLDQQISNVELLGSMWGEELNEVLNSARFIIVPSLWHENFPYVIFQAFACGKPVLGSLRGGIPELVGNSRGLLFEPNNIDDLAKKMQILWDDKNSCASMGVAARKFVETQFNDTVFYEAIMDNYRSVLK
ncbi:MAG: glycosyltransferase involved in cell wall biosynthesis [Francisellaceae bacterium]|jgi:glycosyltransferase involved in cell wall biosynthesis